MRVSLPEQLQLRSTTQDDLALRSSGASKPQKCKRKRHALDQKELVKVGWEFAAAWGDDPAKSWQWTWRRIADDSGEVLAHSGPFLRLDDCIEDARRHGFDEGDCAPVE